MRPSTYDKIAVVLVGIITALALLVALTWGVCL